MEERGFISNTYDGTATVGTLRKEKLELEENLRRYIGERVGEFKKETGYCPSSIEVVMADSTSVKDKNRQYEVVNIIANVEVFTE